MKAGEVGLGSHLADMPDGNVNRPCLFPTDTLDAIAHAVIDLDAAHALNDARNALFRAIGRTRSAAA